MKKEGHPDYNNVVFVDVSTNREFPTRSTMKSKETKVLDGVEHFVIRREVTMDSHPAYTGEKRFRRHRRSRREVQHQVSVASKADGWFAPRDPSGSPGGFFIAHCANRASGW
ncbi:50S ribosomal protein L31 type B [Verrucomicrobiota bacterium]|nr:50S ribosomal protein L31 type B [Verrucomicrobiota bacterium]